MGFGKSFTVWFTLTPHAFNLTTKIVYFDMWGLFSQHNDRVLDRNFIIFIQEYVFENVICQYGGHFVQGEMS